VDWESRMTGINSISWLRGFDRRHAETWRSELMREQRTRYPGYWGKIRCDHVHNCSYIISSSIHNLLAAAHKAAPVISQYIVLTSTTQGTVWIYCCVCASAGKYLPRETFLPLPRPSTHHCYIATLSTQKQWLI